MNDLTKEDQGYRLNYMTVLGFAGESDDHFWVVEDLSKAFIPGVKEWVFALPENWYIEFIAGVTE